MESSDSDSGIRPTALKGWTKDEKYSLLDALKCYGSEDIENISLSIGKTVEETIAALTYFKRKAHKHIPPSVKTKNTKLSHGKNEAPLANWAKLATEFSSYQEIQTETVNMSSALRLIAEFENLPKPIDTNNINFKEVYNLIANALEGKPLNESSNSKFVLEKCIIETALLSKSFIDKNDVVCALDVYKKESGHIRDPKNIEMSTLHHLLVQKFYNPYNIAEQYLRPKRT